MYRVYLDWNIISSLKNFDENQELNKINRFIIEERLNIIVPYSPAHIQDLLKGSENPENLVLIRRDLDFLDSISQRNCMQFEPKNNRVEPLLGSAHDLFDSYLENKSQSILNPDYIVKMFNETPYPQLGSLIKRAWQMKSVEIDFDKMEVDPESKILLAKYFKRTRIEKNMYNLMLDISEFYHDMNLYPEIYKSITDIFRRQAGIDPKVVSNLKQPIEQLNNILANSKIGFDFDRMSSLEVEDNNEYVNNSFVKYSIEYSTLDMSGYHPDTLGKKNLFSNLTNDSHHSFYAGHCDYLVSYDDKLLFKSKVLYEKYKVSTKVMSPKEFIEDISNNIKEKFDSMYLFDSINNTLLESPVSEIKEHDFKDSTIFLFCPKTSILAYFNLLYRKLENSQRNTIILRHVSRNFSNFTFYSEFEAIVNKCAKIFGVDVSGKELFTNEDQIAINKNEWSGRIWWNDLYLFELLSDPILTGVQLIIEEITDDFLNELNEVHLR